jgi:hypothetical protein
LHCGWPVHAREGPYHRERHRICACCCVCARGYDQSICVHVCVLRSTGENAGKAVLGVNGATDVALEDGDHLVVLGIRRINSQYEKKVGSGWMLLKW